MKKYFTLLLFFLSACNTVNLKENSLDKSQLIYAQPGGYQMRHAIKTALEERGYHVVVGKAKSDVGGDQSVDIVWNDTMNARYIVRTSELVNQNWLSTFGLDNLICIFNGYQWWTFNISISDQKTGEELLAWTGRGCANGNIRRLDRLLDKIEKNQSFNSEQ